MILDILKTKRLIREADNPFVPGTWVISMDIGYSNVVAVSPNKLFSIPMEVRKSAVTASVDIQPNNDVIRYKVPNGAAYDVGARYPPNGKEYIPNSDYWEQIEMLRVLMETVLGMSLLDNGVRTYNGETIRAVCCLPEEYEESSNFTMLKTMLEGHHTFDLIPPEAADWVHFDFTVNSAVIIPQSFANSFFYLYHDKTTYSEIINCNPPLFHNSVGGYLKYLTHYSCNKSFPI